MRTAAVLTVLVVPAAARCPVSGAIRGDGPCPGSLRGAVENLADDPPPDAGQGTWKGCKCKSYCGADITDNFNCDYCRTEDNCGRSGIGGSWDYCSYPENKTYEAQTSDAKTAYLWGKINENKQHGDYPNVLNIVGESIQTTFDDWWDVMPNGRKKYIHSAGVVCKFKWSGNPAFTGLLGEAAEGFVRMGSAAPLTGNPGSPDGVTPGNGFKFLRTGVRSGNFVSLASLTLANAGWNFFSKNQSNHIAAPTGATAILAKKFNQASTCAPQVGLSDLAKWSQDGTASAKPVFPFRLQFNPTKDVQQSNDAKTLDQMLDGMKFKVGTSLFDVLAYKTPSDKAPVSLGTMVVTGECTTSAFGDAKLFIRHQRVEEDWAIHPEWLRDPSYDAKAACGSDVSITPPQKCSAE